jgi:hypothetical protein
MMQYYWIRYGDVQFINSKKSYTHLTGRTLDQLVLIIKMQLMLSASLWCFKRPMKQHTDCVLESLYKMEPPRSCQSTKMVFADGFLTNQVLTDLGLQNTTLFLDQYHMINEIWPKELGGAYLCNSFRTVLRHGECINKRLLWKLVERSWRQIKATSI